MRRWPYILLVDDDADFRATVRLSLELSGWQVAEAADGGQALEALAARPPLLVLLDLNMPVLNGRELLQRMRQDEALCQVPVLVLSGFGFEWEAELMGAQGYVGKPCGPGELARAISAILRPRLVPPPSPPAPQRPARS